MHSLQTEEDKPGQRPVCVQMSSAPDPGPLKDNGDVFVHYWGSYREFSPTWHTHLPQETRQLAFLSLNRSS